MESGIIRNENGEVLYSSKHEHYMYGLLIEAQAEGIDLRGAVIKNCIIWLDILIKTSFENAIIENVIIYGLNLKLKHNINKVIDNLLSTKSLKGSSVKIYGSCYDQIEEEKVSELALRGLKFKVLR